MKHSIHYKKTVVRCACILLASAALQLFTGGVDVSFLEYPWGVVLAANYLYLLVLVSFNKDKWRWTEMFTNRQTYIVLLATMLGLTLLFGLIRQDGAGGGIIKLLGFAQMKSSWVFNVFLFYFTTVVGIKAIDDIRNFKKQKLHALIMHVSFFAILFAGIFGSGEKTRVRLKAIQGEPINIGTTNDGKRVELPFVVRLKEFSLEEYPPQVHLLSDDNLSKEKIVLEDDKSRGMLGKWSVECVEYIEMAGQKPGDSVYIPMNHVGATSAARIRATDGDETVEGWVSCGSHIFKAATLLLPDGGAFIMPRREIKKYLSEVEVINDGNKEIFNISVNNPATVGAWKIYQSGYDETRGQWSTISVLECVKDGWYPVAHVAMWLILMAGLFTLLLNRKSKKK